MISDIIKKASQNEQQNQTPKTTNIITSKTLCPFRKKTYLQAQNSVE